jgi:hypothetical protein
MRDDVHLQPVFLVERYLPGLTHDAITELATRLVDAAQTLQTTRSPASWLGSIALLPEETIFCAFDACSEDAVQALNELASAPYERVTNAVLIKPRETHQTAI